MSKIDSNPKRPLEDVNWHMLSLSEIESILETDLNKGLTAEKAQLLLNIYGENTIATISPRPKLWKIFLDQLRSFTSLLLLAFALWCFIFNILDKNESIDHYLGIISLLTVVILSLHRSYQEAKDYENNSSPISLNSPRCQAIRGGYEMIINSSQLVPGDIVVVKQGDIIPAEIRILESYDCKIDQSILTGEAMPISKTANTPTVDNILEAGNIAFAHTICVSGSAKAVVFATGMNLFIAKISALASSSDDNADCISYKYTHRRLLIIFAFAIIARVLGILLGFRFNFTLLNFILTVGLTLIGIDPYKSIEEITTYFTSKILKKYIGIKKLESIKIFSESPIIIVDKSGTMTENKLKAAQLWFDGDFKATENLIIDSNKIKFAASTMIMNSAILINDARFDNNQQLNEKLEHCSTDQHKNIIENWSAKGPATDIALIKLFRPFIDIEYEREWKKPTEINGNIMKIPFNSRNKYAVTVYSGHELGYENEYIAFYNGSVEVLLNMSTNILHEDSELYINEDLREKIIEIYHDFSKKGLRVSAFAYKWLNRSDFSKELELSDNMPEFLKKNLIFSGMITFDDPLRKNVKESMLNFKNSNMKCIIATGDLLPKTSVVAKQVCIINNPKTTTDFEAEGIDFYESLELTDSTLVHGDLFNRLTSVLETDELAKQQLYKILNQKELVFGRMTPTQKLLIVEQYQEMGNEVIYIGDGMNDLPAMKRSDVSFAMGKTATSAVLENSDMILLDDNFGSAFHGFKIFEAYFNNLQKSAQHILASNMPELIPFFIFVILQLPSAFTVILILLIDLGIDITPSIAISYSSSLDITNKKPKDLIESQLKYSKSRFFSIIQPGLREALAGFMAYFIVMENFGFNLQTLWLMNNSRSGTIPGIDDVYDPNNISKGNSHYGLVEYENILFDYTAKVYDSYDLRVWFYGLSPDAWPTCSFPDLYSPFTDELICYSGEALYYAQYAWFVSVIIGKLLNFFIIGAAKREHHYHRLSKKVAFWSIILGLVLSLSLCYVPITSELLDGRPLPLLQFGLPALPSFLLLIQIDYIRSLIISKNPLGIISLY